MELTAAFKQRIDGYLIARTALPLPGEMPSGLIVISIGETKGKWSFKHVYADGDTRYFIFRKADLTNIDAHWTSADHELEAWVEDHKTEHV